MRTSLFATLWGALLALSSASRAEEPSPSGHDAAAPSTPFSAVALADSSWHDGFGTRASHGCVNLSLADARWLFDWAPPRLPPGWNVVEAKEVGAEALWVLIEARAPLAPMAPISRTEGANHSIAYSAVRALKADVGNAR